MDDLPVGFLTNVLFQEGMSAFPEVVEFAASNGFSTLEIGPTYELTDQLVQTVESRRLEISDLIYCRNLLSEDAEAAAHHRNEVMRRIELAARYGIPIVTLSAGIVAQAQSEVYDNYEAIRPLPARSIESFLAVYQPIVERAEKHGVKIAFENCPLMGNWAISPYLWEQLFDRLQSPQVGLTYDPCHLSWQFMDPYEPILRFRERIFHLHAKDVEIDWQRLKDRGILTDFSWWQTRIPGWGIINWRKLLGLLAQIGYSGSISIEHEDPLFRGSIDRAKRGLLLGKGHLQEAARLIREHPPE